MEQHKIESKAVSELVLCHAVSEKANTESYIWVPSLPTITLLYVLENAIYLRND